MTILIGAIDAFDVVMGADTAVLDQSVGIVVPDAASKLVSKGALLIGVSGSLRLLQLIQHRFELPEHGSDEVDEAWMVAKFIPALQLLIEEHDIHDHEDSGDQPLPGGLLAGVSGSEGGKLFEIYADYHVLSRPEWGTVGMASELAMGSLATSGPARDSQGALWGAEKRVSQALLASKYSVSVEEPFNIKRTVMCYRPEPETGVRRRWWQK